MNEDNLKDSAQVKKCIYAFCPHCECANVHVLGGKLGRHHVGITGPVCRGSDMEAHGQRETAMEKNDPGFFIALQQAQYAAFGDSLPPEPPMRHAFQTWKFSGLEFLSVPNDRNSEQIIDSAGANYGSWLSVAEFRKRQKSGLTADWQSLGSCHLNVCCDRS